MKNKLILISAILATTGCGDPSPRDPTEIGAYSACQIAVKNRLKNPNNAEFESYRNSTVTVLKQLKVAQEWRVDYRVLGTVYAQNSFGAKVRTLYGCDVKGRTALRYPNWSVMQVEFL